MLPESKNIQTIADNIRSLENQINALDVEIPPHASTDAGKILAVDSDGDLEWKNENPPYVPPAYSTEEVNTGQKWIDGKDIYCRVFSSNTPETSSSGTYYLIDLDDNNVISCYGYITLSDVRVFFNTATGAGNIFLQQKETGEIAFTTNSASSFSNKPFTLVVYYTKPDPTPSTETKSKKGGNKK